MCQYAEYSENLNWKLKRKETTETVKTFMEYYSLLLFHFTPKMQDRDTII